MYYKQALEAKGYTVQIFVDDVYMITHDFDCVMTSGLYRAFPFFRVFPIVFKYRCLYTNCDGCILANIKGHRWCEADIYKVAGIKVLIIPYGADVQITECTPNLCFKNALYKDYSTLFKTYQGLILKRVTYWCRHADAVIGMGNRRKV